MSGNCADAALDEFGAVVEGAGERGAGGEFGGEVGWGGEAKDWG